MNDPIHSSNEIARFFNLQYFKKEFFDHISFWHFERYVVKKQIVTIVFECKWSDKSPAGNYVLKVNSRNTRTRCEIYLKLNIFYTLLTLNIFHTLFQCLLSPKWQNVPKNKCLEKVCHQSLMKIEVKLFDQRYFCKKYVYHTSITLIMWYVDKYETIQNTPFNRVWSGFPGTA